MPRTTDSDATNSSANTDPPFQEFTPEGYNNAIGHLFDTGWLEWRDCVFMRTDRGAYACRETTPKARLMFEWLNTAAHHLNRGGHDASFELRVAPDSDKTTTAYHYIT